LETEHHSERNSRDKVAERITALRAAGAARILLWAGPDSQSAVSLLRRFKREVVPRIVPTGSESRGSLGVPQQMQGQHSACRGANATKESQ